MNSGLRRMVLTAAVLFGAAGYAAAKFEPIIVEPPPVFEPPVFEPPQIHFDPPPFERAPIDPFPNDPFGRPDPSDPLHLRPSDPFGDLLRPPMKSWEEIQAETHAAEQRTHQADLEVRAAKDPLAVLSELHSPLDLPGLLGGPDLPPGGKEAVTQKALDGLSQEASRTLDHIRRPDAGADSWTLLAEAREVKAELESAKSLTGSNRLEQSIADLTAEKARLEKTCLEDALRHLTALGEKGRWADAGALAEKRIGELGDTVQDLEPLRRFEVEARRQEAVKKVEAALAPDKGGPHGLSGDAVEALPESLRSSVTNWEKVEEIQGILDGRWPQTVGETRPDLPPDGDRPPDPTAGWESASNMQRLLGDLDALAKRGEDPALVQRLYRDLAVKAFLEGHAKQANQLLDASAKAGPKAPGDADAAAALLRDVKAVVLGEGSVETWPAKTVLEEKAGDSTHATRGPPTDAAPPAGARALLPEGDAQGWRPPVVEPASADLPPLPEEFHPVVEADRKTVQDELKKEQTDSASRTKTLLADAHRIAGPPPTPPTIVVTNPPPKKDDDKQAKEAAALMARLEKAPGRPLTDKEKERALQLYGEGRSFDGILEELRAAATKDGDDPR